MAQGNQYGNRQGRGNGAPMGGPAGFSDNDASTLSVFSETGEQFFLVLNGINQNNIPTSKIRVEGLPQYGNEVQILFADRRTPEIRKRVNIADPVDGKAVNMTLKIVRGRDGFARLKFHKCSEVDRGYHAERDEYVMRYGKPVQINSYSDTYQDPVTGQVITQTTTTTTTNDRDHRFDRVPAGPVAMDQRSFNDAITAINGASFEDTKMSTAKTIFSSNYLTTDQVITVCKQFSFEDRKLAFAKFAYDKTVDRNNYFKVASVFDFDSNKRALNDFISANNH
jgi:hypothetical protein